MLREKGFAVLMWEQRGFYKHVLHGSVRILAKNLSLLQRYPQRCEYAF